MTVSINIGIKQSQKLVMTQSLRQAIEMLQLSTIELSEQISKELLENPVIEEEISPGLPVQAENTTVLSRMNQELSGDDSIEKKRDEQRAAYDDTSDSGYTPVIGDDDRKRSFIENAIVHQESLADHLLWQAKMVSADEIEYNFYQDVITSLDENGFLPSSRDNFIKNVKIDPEIIKNIIISLHLFDPVGCGTENLRESLYVQAKHYNPNDDILLLILKDYFEDLEKLKYDDIAKKIKISVRDVIEKCKIIQNFDPYPGRQYSRREIRYIVPDIEVKLFENDIIITFNDDWLPVIRINSYYQNLIRKKNIGKKQKEYIQEKLQSAKNFLSNIENRKDTILRVVNAIMEYQKEFLIKGPGHLKSLTHLDIANQIGVHESTVSRVTSSKFVQTGWGVYDLKYFFVSKLGSGSTENSEQSSDQVRRLIKELINKEDPMKPLSDESIVLNLKKNNIDVARRTIAKYRGILDIPPSGIRKRQNKIKMEERL